MKLNDIIGDITERLNTYKLKYRVDIVSKLVNTIITDTGRSYSISVVNKDILKSQLLGTNRSLLFTIDDNREFIAVIDSSPRLEIIELFSVDECGIDLLSKWIAYEDTSNEDWDDLCNLSRYLKSLPERFTVIHYMLDWISKSDIISSTGIMLGNMEFSIFGCRLDGEIIYKTVVKDSQSKLRVDLNVNSKDLVQTVEGYINSSIIKFLGSNPETLNDFSNLIENDNNRNKELRTS